MPKKQRKIKWCYTKSYHLVIFDKIKYPVQNKNSIVRVAHRIFTCIIHFVFQCSVLGCLDWGYQMKAHLLRPQFFSFHKTEAIIFHKQSHTQKKATKGERNWSSDQGQVDGDRARTNKWGEHLIRGSPVVTSWIDPVQMSKDRTFSHCSTWKKYCTKVNILKGRGLEVYVVPVRGRSKWKSIVEAIVSATWEGLQ